VAMYFLKFYLPSDTEHCNHPDEIKGANYKITVI